MTIPCSECGGSGTFDVSAPDARRAAVTDCARCNGSGDEPCEYVEVEPGTYRIVHMCKAAATTEEWIMSAADERSASLLALCPQHQALLQHRRIHSCPK
jgi:hypothetical protein